MIENRLEYQRMYEVEQKLWWYKVLHNKVLTTIKNHFGKDYTQLKILDAACGTGGLLSFLHNNGCKNLTGFDYSQHAVDFSLERNLDVTWGDLKRVEEFRPEESYDVICCCDALYFLNDHEITHTLSVLKKRLRPNGIIIINIHAFEAFSGTHDLAVGSTRRFVLNDFQFYTKQANLQIVKNTYWPFFLSLPIWAVRQFQKLQIKKGWIKAQEVDSDVKYPGDLINQILQLTMSVEETLIPQGPFGSSLFMVMTSHR